MSNCKLGDRAFIVGMDPGDPIEDLGAIVRIVGIGNSYAHLGDDRFYWAVVCEGRPVWLTSDRRGLVLSAPGEVFDHADAYLRPIRDSDGTDETLLLAGLPQTNKNEETVA